MKTSVMFAMDTLSRGNDWFWFLGDVPWTENVGSITILGYTLLFFFADISQVYFIVMLIICNYYSVSSPKTISKDRENKLKSHQSVNPNDLWNLEHSTTKRTTTVEVQSLSWIIKLVSDKSYRWRKWRQLATISVLESDLSVSPQNNVSQPETSLATVINYQNWWGWIFPPAFII